MTSAEACLYGLRPRLATFTADRPPVRACVRTPRTPVSACRGTRDTTRNALALEPLLRIACPRSTAARSTTARPSCRGRSMCGRRPRRPDRRARRAHGNSASPVEWPAPRTVRKRPTRRGSHVSDHEVSSGSAARPGGCSSSFRHRAVSYSRSPIRGARVASRPRPLHLPRPFPSDRSPPRHPSRWPRLAMGSALDRARGPSSGAVGGVAVCRLLRLL